MRLTPNYRWWKPLLTLVLAAVFFLLFQVLFVIPFVIYFVAIQYTGSSDILEFQAMIQGFQEGGYGGFITDSPLSIVFVLTPLILLIPAVALALKITGLGSLGTLSSVEGRLRWDRLRAYLVPAFVLVVLGGFLLPWIVELALAGELTLGELPSLPTPHVVPAALVAILILGPLQCAAEEYAFRGFLMQVFGSWIPVVVIPIALQTLLFTIGHPYELSGMIAIACMGLIMGGLTVRLGGLEAAIAFHVANNLPSFLFTSLFTNGTVAEDTGTTTLFATVGLYLIYAGVALSMAKKRGWLAIDPPYLDTMLSLPRAHREREIQAAGAGVWAPAAQAGEMWTGAAQTAPMQAGGMWTSAAQASPAQAGAIWSGAAQTDASWAPSTQTGEMWAPATQAATQASEAPSTPRSNPYTQWPDQWPGNEPASWSRGGSWSEPGFGHQSGNTSTRPSDSPPPPPYFRG